MKASPKRRHQEADPDAWKDFAADADHERYLDALEEKQNEMYHAEDCDYE